jgi:hypothetical protein
VPERIDEYHKVKQVRSQANNQQDDHMERVVVELLAPLNPKSSKQRLRSISLDMRDVLNEIWKPRALVIDQRIRILSPGQHFLLNSRTVQQYPSFMDLFAPH